MSSSDAQQRAQTEAEAFGQHLDAWASSYTAIPSTSSSTSSSSKRVSSAAKPHSAGYGEAEVEPAVNPFGAASAESRFAAAAGAAGAATGLASSTTEDTDRYGGDDGYDSDSSTRELPFEPRVFYSFDEFPQMRPLHDAFDDIQRELRTLDVVQLNIFRSRDRWTETIGGSFFEQCSKQYGWIHSWQVESEEQNADWLNFGLIHQDKALKENAKRCPKTMAVFNKIIEKYGNAEEGRPAIRVAGFSLMRPNSAIPPHTDTTGLRYNCMAYHLGLVVPEPDKCVLTVGGIDAKEENGKSLVFDATYMHEAVNKCARDRIILYVDFCIDTGKGLTF